jgi:hypothetical protein
MHPGRPQFQSIIARLHFRTQLKISIEGKLIFFCLLQWFITAHQLNFEYSMLMNHTRQCGRKQGMYWVQKENIKWMQCSVVQRSKHIPVCWIRNTTSVYCSSEDREANTDTNSKGTFIYQMIIFKWQRNKPSQLAYHL